VLDHTHALGTNSEDKLPNQHFLAWLKDNTALFVSQFLALLSFIYVPTSTVYYAYHATHLEQGPSLSDLNPYVLVIIDVAHIAVITLFVARRVSTSLRHSQT
jgi:hypothetical protein